MKHDTFCEQQTAPFYTSGCEPFCDYYKEAIQQCKDEGEHFRRIVSENGYDVCHNCGAKA